MFSRSLVAAAAGLALAAAAHAVPVNLAVYDLAPYNGDNTLEATATMAGVTAGAISRTATLTGSSFSNHYYYSGWGTTIEVGKYFSMTLSSTTPMSLVDMLFSVESTASTGTSSVTVRSSLDAFASNVDSFSWSGELVTNGDLDLSGLGTLGAAPLELRFYFTSSAGGAPAVGFANHEVPGTGGGLADTGRDIFVRGEAVAVPLPGSLTLAGLGLLIAAGTLRRTRR